MRKVAIYRKGGIGMITTTQDTVAGLAQFGKFVLFAGCDPKAYPTSIFLGGLAKKTIPANLFEQGEEVKLGDVVKPGFNGSPDDDPGFVRLSNFSSLSFLKLNTHWSKKFYFSSPNTLCSSK